MEGKDKEADDVTKRARRAVTRLSDTWAELVGSMAALKKHKPDVYSDEIGNMREDWHENLVRLLELDVEMED